MTAGDRSLPDLEHALCNMLILPIHHDLFPDAQADRDEAVEELRYRIANHPDRNA